jgi:hypothetical protein
MLARIYGSDAGNRLLGHRVAADTVPSCQHGEWAERMEHVSQTTERFPTEGQTGAHGRLQPMLQGVQVRVESLPTNPRIESRQGFGGKMQTFATFLDTVLPLFL